MLFVLLGDSNLRQTFTKYKDQIIAETEVENIKFEQISNNESLRVALEKERDPKPNLFYINSLLNEIGAKTGKGKTRENAIKNVTMEQNTVVNRAAGESGNTATLYLICNPMLRQEPKWIEEQLNQIKFYVYENFSIYSPTNVAVVAEPIIEPADLAADKVHLNEGGQKKFFDRIVADFKVGKEEIEKFDSEGMEWDDLCRFSQKTPKTRKANKRQRTPAVTDSPTGETNSPTTKRTKDDEDLKSIMKAFMVEIRSDRKKTADKTDELEESIDKLKEAEIEIRQEMNSLKNVKEEDNIFSATVREDLDAIENENLRNTVIVKKLKTKEKLSVDKAEMLKLVQAAARDLVTELNGEDADQGIVFITLLYTGKDGLKITKGLLPPFKVIFKTKEAGIAFRDKGVARSKVETDKLHKTYFTCQQCAATRIRTVLMWGLVDKLKNPLRGIDSWVNQSLNKPTLQVKGEERNQRSYTFVGAMLQYRDKLDDKTKEDALKLAKRFFPGQIEKIFIVIKD